MRTGIISRTVLLPAGQKEIYEHLKKTDTLNYIAKPYASFERIPVEDTTEKETKEENGDCWEEGADYVFSLKIFGGIPIGLHRVHILHFDEEEVSTLEGNSKVPIWNHRIVLNPVSDETCEYTDELEIGAGFWTGAVCLFARSFLKHRQKKWLKLLEK